MKERIISAIIAIIICIPVIIYGGTLYCFLASIIGLIGFNELLKTRTKQKDYPNIMKLISIILFILLMFNQVGNKIFISLQDIITLTILLLITPITYYHKTDKYNIEDALYLLGSVIFLGCSFNKLLTIRLDNLYIFLYLLIITVSTDTFAYFTGRLIGTHKMCKTLSPKKTWEGLIGGILFGVIISTTYFSCIIDYNGSTILIILITLLLSIIAELGDLVFSAIKRHYNIKDYGKIMPGHGGVLDRLDSLLFVLLVFSYISKYL